MAMLASSVLLVLVEDGEDARQEELVVLGVVDVSAATTTGREKVWDEERKAPATGENKINGSSRV